MQSSSDWQGLFRAHFLHYLEVSQGWGKRDKLILGIHTTLGDAVLILLLLNILLLKGN